MSEGRTTETPRTMIGAYGTWAAGFDGTRAPDAFVPIRPVGGCRRVAVGGPRTPPGPDRAAGVRRPAKRSGRPAVHLRRAPRRGAAMGPALRSSHPCPVPEARGRARAPAGRPRPARPRRQPLFRQAQDHPHLRSAPSGHGSASGAGLRRRGMGQPDRQTRLRGARPRRILLRQPARARGRPSRLCRALDHGQGAPHRRCRPDRVARHGHLCVDGVRAGAGGGDRGVQPIRRAA